MLNNIESRKTLKSEMNLINTIESPNNFLLSYKALE